MKEAEVAAGSDDVNATSWGPVAALLTSPDARQPVVHRKLFEIGAIRHL